MSADIVGLGEALIEMVRLPNRINERQAFVQGFGGDTSTAIIAAARQGANVGYISAVGDDMFGTALRDLWAREGVDHTHVLKSEGRSTGVCFIDPDPAGRQFTYARAASAATTFGPGEVPEQYVAGSKVLHLSGITLAISGHMQEAALKAVEIAKANETLVSLDLNHRPRLWTRKLALEKLAEVARQADIVFASDDEANLLFGDETPDAVADRFLEWGAQIAVAKQGAEGALVALSDWRFPVPPEPATPIDSSGAGDSFAGAFLAWYLETHDPQVAAKKAAVVAAATVSGLGAVEPIPRR